MTSMEEIVNLVEEVQSTPDVFDNHERVAPPHNDGRVILPVGLLTPAGLVDTAEVRELNGYDEEAFGKARTAGAGVLALLERATVSIGDEPATKKLLEQLTVGDRLELMIAIHTVTWGDNIEVAVFCDNCRKAVKIDLSASSIERTPLSDKVADRVFEVALPSGKTATIGWPSGKVQEKVLEEAVKTTQEMTTLLVTDCVRKIDGIPLLQGEDSARALSVADRRAIALKIQEGIPGPKLTELSSDCPDCGETLEYSLQVSALFPL